MIQINVSQQLKTSIGSIRNYKVSGIVDIGDGNNLVQGKLRLMRTDRSILAKGTLHSEIKLACSRCLSLFDWPLTLNIEEEYFPTIDVVTDASLPLPDEPSCFTINKYNILDLTETIRQYTLLAIPMKPLCGEDCAGLCPGCGCNLNQAPCECPPQVASPSWSKLRELALANNNVSVNERKGTE